SGLGCERASCGISEDLADEHFGLRMQRLEPSQALLEVVRQSRRSGSRRDGQGGLLQPGANLQGDRVVESSEYAIRQLRHLRSPTVSRPQNDFTLSSDQNHIGVFVVQGLRGKRLRSRS